MLYIPNLKYGCPVYGHSFLQCEYCTIYIELSKAQVEGYSLLYQIHIRVVQTWLIELATGDNRLASFPTYGTRYEKSVKSFLGYVTYISKS